MKNTIVIMAAIAGTLLSGCRDKTTTNEGNIEATDADNTAVASEAPEKGGGGLMEAMNDMMDNIHGLEKKGITDYDLAAELREHHKRAIAMSEEELSSGSDAQLKEMARKIKEAQQKEVEQIGEMLNKYDDMAKDYDPLNADTGLGKAMMENMKAMMEVPVMDQASVDKSFAAMMAKHHKDGVKMGQTILKFAQDTAFRQMAQKMITDQQREIKELENWLEKHR